MKKVSPIYITIDGIEDKSKGHQQDWEFFAAAFHYKGVNKSPLEIVGYPEQDKGYLDRGGFNVSEQEKYDYDCKCRKFH